MMADVLDERTLLINEQLEHDHPPPPRLSRALLVVEAAHTCVVLAGLVFWLVVVGNSQDLDTEVVPAAWLLLAAVFALPVTLNLACVAWRRWRTGRARDAEFVLFQSVWGLRLTCGAALLGLLCSVTALAGALMGQEESAAVSAAVHALTCFSLALVCAGVLATMPEESRQTNLYRKLEERPALHRRLLSYALLALLLLVVVFALGINGSAAFRLFSRGYVFRHDKPHRSDYVQISEDGRMFFLACRGSGAGPDSDVVVLMDADLASSSYGWSWLTPSMSNLWTTCVFDRRVFFILIPLASSHTCSRPGYGWSTVSRLSFLALLVALTSSPSGGSAASDSLAGNGRSAAGAAGGGAEQQPLRVHFARALDLERAHVLPPAAESRRVAGLYRSV